MSMSFVTLHHCFNFTMILKMYIEKNKDLSIYHVYQQLTYSYILSIILISVFLKIVMIRIDLLLTPCDYYSQYYLLYESIANVG